MSDETPVTSALHMDRSLPLGNSEDIDGRRALHTKIKNNPNEPIYVVASASVAAANPTINNFHLTLSNTEYEYDFQANVKLFTIKARGSSKVQFSYIAGQSGSQYMTIWPGSMYSQDQILASNLKIYFQSNHADETLEILEWS